MSNKREERDNLTERIENMLKDGRHLISDGMDALLNVLTSLTMQYNETPCKGNMDIFNSRNEKIGELINDIMSEYDGEYGANVDFSVQDGGEE